MGPFSPSLKIATGHNVRRQEGLSSPPQAHDDRGRSPPRRRSSRHRRPIPQTQRTLTHSHEAHIQSIAISIRHLLLSVLSTRERSPRSSPSRSPRTVLSTPQLKPRTTSRPQCTAMPTHSRRTSPPMSISVRARKTRLIRAEKRHIAQILKPVRPPSKE